MNTESTPLRPRLSPARGSAWVRRKTLAENKVLKQIRENKGFSVFWATENQDRARAIDRLQQRGIIAHNRKSKLDRFPWCVYRIMPNISNGTKSAAKDKLQV